MRRIGGLVFALCLLAVPAAGQTNDAATQAFASQLAPGATLPAFTERLRQEFRQLDADSDGVLTAADADLHDAVAKAQMRSFLVMQIVRADLDHDGFVTEDELRKALAYERRQQTGPSVAQGIEAEVRRIMALDKDNDGKVSLAEAMNGADLQPQNRLAVNNGVGQRVRQLLTLSRSGDGRLTLADFEAAGAEHFRAVDADGNGTISNEELTAYRQRQVEEIQRKSEEARRKAEETRRNAEAERRRNAEEARAAECAMPKATEAAKVVMLAAYRSEAISRVTLGSQDVETGTAEIKIEPGAEPLYIVLIAREATIWRLTGAVDRVERVVGASRTNMQSKVPVNVSGGTITLGAPDRADKKEDLTPLMGFTGVPAERVSFLARWDCLKTFTEAQSIDAAAAAAVVRRHSGKEPAVIVGRYNVGAFVLPAGEIRSAHDDKKQPRLTIHKEFGQLTLKGDTSGVVVQTGPVEIETELAESAPGGVVDLDEKSVVASAPVARYEILPGLAGLMQLQNSGALTRNKRGEFIIRRQIRFPAGLSAEVTFLLPRGVPAPQGNPEGATVISEETGDRLRFDRR